ncbi:MAG: hypothetical protein ACREN4_04705 [Candidatus Dormibacteria bacterium]
MTGALGLVLVVDGSQRQSPLVLLADGRGGCEWVDEAHGGSDQLLAGMVGALRRAGRGGIFRVLACRGPGSYMGVRAALSAALGVAQGRSLPLLLASSLELVRAQLGEEGGPVLALQDAGRGGTYGQVLGGEEAVPPGLLARNGEWPPEWLGTERATGTLGEGRSQPPGPRWLEPRLDRAAAWSLLAGASRVATDYDHVSADYPAQIGER